MSNPLRSVVIAAVVAALAPVAWAQTPPPPPPGEAQNGPTPAELAARVRDNLRLGPDQEKALQDFLAATQPRPAQTEHFREEADREATLRTPQRLDAMMARMDEMRAVLVARIEATKRFYAQLNPSQRAIFDQVSPSPAPPAPH